ncbi:DUF480 domain-containing protein [Jinshanibacter sp. LJY008]|uniref:DUF480 domain-containing protein n=1 Tax=Limnobaculum eriocheiris TaxID=2897391 RepID=A0A9X1MZP3_9GAMM|nr:DUF480 domain-containing protein [Limnobaculum eriocheiris]MCD1127528.1 DUF480 domain-containing protein [Limnobaculum eriocheiris]
MKYQLTDTEARVIGSMLEKEVTTPDQYPLSLNSLMTACNQKTSREPVMDLSELEVQDTLDSLQKKYLVRTASGIGGRVAKYVHRFCNTEFGDLKLSPAELAVVCLLLLRGPQTPGELRTRSNRLYEFSDINEVEQVLEALSNREDGPYVVRLAREPGRRESRYAHLFCGPVDAASFSTSGSMPDNKPSEAAEGLSERVQQLEDEVALLKQQLAELNEKFEILVS